MYFREKLLWWNTTILKMVLQQISINFQESRWITTNEKTPNTSKPTAHVEKKLDWEKLHVWKWVKGDRYFDSSIRDVKQTFNKYLTNATFCHLLPFTFVFLILEISTVKKRPNFRENKNKLIRSEQALKLAQNVNEVFYKVKHKITPTTWTPSFCL